MNITLKEAKDLAARKQGFSSWQDYLEKEEIGSIMNGGELVNPFKGKSSRIDYHYTVMNAYAAEIYANRRAKEAWNDAIDAAADTAEMTFIEEGYYPMASKDSILELKIKT